MDKLEFKNGSSVTNIECLDSTNRGSRSSIVLYDYKQFKNEGRKILRDTISRMNLKWHQKLRIEVEFIYQDIKEFIIGKLFNRI